MLMVDGVLHAFVFLLTTFAVVYISLNVNFMTSFIPVIGYAVFYLFSAITNYTDKTMELGAIYWNFGITSAYFGLLMLIVYTIEHNVHLRMDILSKEEDFAEKEENELRLRNKNQIVSNMQIERDYDNMITLYETIQNMSGTLESENIIGIYVDTMIALVPLFRGTIVIFAEQEESAGGDASGDRYFAFQSVSHSTGAAQVIEDKRKSPFEGFINQYKKAPLEFYFEPSERDKYAPYAIRKLEHPMIALPIKSDKLVIGVVIVEGAQKRYMEQLKTITTFLGIEIKKTNLYEKVHRLSVNDGLTGLFLRRYFTKRIQDTFGSPETDPPLSLLIVDVDKFKDVNDKYGHQAGDLVLKEVARILEGNARGIDLVCRFGGDEFSVGLPNTTKQEALQIAERLRLTIESNRIAFENFQLRTSVSIGVAAYPEDGRDFETLFSHADLALYAAKNTGSNRVLSFRKAFLK